MEVGITLNNKLVYNREFFAKKEKESIQKMILADSRLSRCAIFAIAALNYTVKVGADVGDTLNKLDKAGFVFLGLAQRIGFWVCLIGCILEILFAVFKEGKGKNALLPIALKWLGIFSSFYLFPTCFELIRDLFS